MNRRHLEALRVVWLFGRPYWWDRDPGGRLALRLALWLDRPGGTS